MGGWQVEGLKNTSVTMLASGHAAARTIPGSMPSGVTIKVTCKTQAGRGVAQAGILTNAN